MKKRILIADDEPNILMLTSIMLEDAGYETILAKNGAQAIEKAVQKEPDLVITDIVMPEKDGFEVCKELRSMDSFKNTPIIILSAIGDEFNKITGFEGGADDYITKPFNLDELRNRVHSLLLRSDAKKGATLLSNANGDDGGGQEVDRTNSGIPEINTILKGGFPAGSNILFVGPIGSGKSTLGRQFLKQGLDQKSRNLFITLDDSPQMIRKKMDECLEKNTEHYEDLSLFSIVDAYSWSSGTNVKKEKFSIDGILDLNQLSMVISDAGHHLGQSIQSKCGGRRVVDSISSLLINFDLSVVQRFLSQLARTSSAFGMVTTLFMLEEGTVDDHILNNIKYIMDGVIETKTDENDYYVRVSNMKWIDYEKGWQKIGNHG